MGAAGAGRTLARGVYPHKTRRAPMRGTGETFGTGTGMTEAYGWEGREVVEAVVVWR
jgi:hypothetical protein